VAVIINWGLAKPSFLLLSAIAAIIICIFSILFCSLWIAQIKDFKLLNNAKFSVLNDMAPRLCFSDSSSDLRVSFKPFEREWEALKKTEALRELSSIRVVALSSSQMEYLIPRAFRVLFLLVFLAVILVIWWNWGIVFDSSSLQLDP